MKSLYGLASSMLSVLVLMVFVLLLSGCDGDREQYTEDGGSDCANGQCHRHRVPQSVDVTYTCLSCQRGKCAATVVPAAPQTLPSTENKQPVVVPTEYKVVATTGASQRTFTDALGNQYLILKRGETPPLNQWYIREENLERKECAPGVPSDVPDVQAVYIVTPRCCGRCR